MGKSIALLCCRAFCLMSSLLTTGCTVAGFGLGALIDPVRPGAQIASPDSVTRLKPGTGIIIQKKNHSKVDGPFLAVGPVGAPALTEGYRSAYDIWRGDSSGGSSRFLPSLDSYVQVRVQVAARSEVYAGRFAGLDSGMVIVALPPRAQLIPLRLEFIQEMRDSVAQRILTREAILQAMRSGAPFASSWPGPLGIRLGGTSEVLVPFDEIQTVYLPRGGSGKWIGLVSGILVDISLELFWNVYSIASEFRR